MGDRKGNNETEAGKRDRWEERKIRKDRKQRYTEAARSQEEEGGGEGKERQR